MCVCVCVCARAQEHERERAAQASIAELTQELEVALMQQKAREAQDKVALLEQQQLQRLQSVESRSGVGTGTPRCDTRHAEPAAAEGSYSVANSVKRDLVQCQKRPSTVSKETHYAAEGSYSAAKQGSYSVAKDMRKRRLTFEEISAPSRATGSALSARGVGERSGNEGKAAMKTQEEAREAKHTLESEAKHMLESEAKHMLESTFEGRNVTRNGGWDDGRRTFLRSVMADAMTDDHEKKAMALLEVARAPDMAAPAVAVAGRAQAGTELRAGDATTRSGMQRPADRSRQERETALLRRVM
jgi:hypothetical protein